jgi:hypothetical protein
LFFVCCCFASKIFNHQTLLTHSASSSSFALDVQQCIARIHKKKPTSKAEAKKALFALAMEEFAKPGDTAFPANAFFEAPKNKDEAGMFLPIYFFFF